MIHKKNILQFRLNPLHIIKHQDIMIINQMKVNLLIKVLITFISQVLDTKAKMLLTKNSKRSILVNISQQYNI